MAALALSDALPDFGRRPQAGTRVSVSRPTVEEAAIVRVEPDPELLRAEIARAEQALAERLAVEHQHALNAQAELHASEMAALRAELGDMLGQRLGERLDALEARLVEMTASVTARILASAVTEDIQRRALEQLGNAIAAAIGDREAVRIRVRGPSSLYEALLPALGRHAGHVEFTETADTDLSVAVDDSLFETRLSQWSSALAGVFE